MNNKDTKTKRLSFENTAIAFADKSDLELKEAYWMYKLINNGTLVELGSFFTNMALKFRFPVKPVVKATVFKLFVGGESLEEARPKIERLAGYGINTILDYGVEAKSSEYDYNKTLQEKLNAIAFAGNQKSVKVLSCKITGLGRFRLFEKVHAGERISLTEEREMERVVDRVEQLCEAAKRQNIALFFDAEESWIQRPLDIIIREMMEQFNQEKVIVYNTYQMYLKNRSEDMKQHYKDALESGFKFGVKLVRGAYMEKERDRAHKMNYPSPIYDNKPAVDEAYNKALRYCLDDVKNIALCAATHNEESCMYLADEIEKSKISNDHPHLMFAQLLGMGENLTFNLADYGFHTAKLVPFGPVKDVIPYLIRRARENSSAEGQMSRELSLLKNEIERRRIFSV
ncbi:MAG: proline dehydrogenase family protein [Chitinophagales bacterium]